MEGDGLATLGRRPISIPFVIPGERVRVSLVSDRATRATLDAVLAPSLHRVVPACRHHGRSSTHGTGRWCGGCQWQHIAYRHQLTLKRELVHALIHEVVPDAPPADPTLPGAPLDEPWGFRHKVHFLVSDVGPLGRTRPALGHYAAGSRRFTPVTECPVHASRGNELAFAFLDHMSALSARSRSVLRSVAIRVAAHTAESMVTVVAAAEADRALRAATRRFIDDTTPTSVHLNLHDRDDAYVFGPHTRTLAGTTSITERVADCRFSIGPTAFFQTNIQAAETLVSLVLDLCGPATTVADLYAGGGLFAIPLARAGHRVVAVESHRGAVAGGIRASSASGVSREACRFIESTVEDAVRQIGSPAVVVLDPPREGCSPSVLAAVRRRLRPRRIVYVSCHPTSLVRDLGLLVPDYHVRRVQPVDMFPHTAHVETVVVLDRRGPDTA